MTKNLKLFREMSEPFETKEAALEAVALFIKDVAEARERHKITNVLTTINVNFIAEDGLESEANAAHMLGDSSQAEALAAMTYGQMKSEHEARIARMLKGKSNA